MNLLLCMAVGLLFDGSVKFNSVAQFEPIPEDSNYFLQTPTSFDVDASGNYYVVDVEAKVVFTWDKSGAFRKAIGAPGEGPGEFQFSGRGPGAGYITVLKNQLYVYDGRKREVLVFDQAGTFIKSVSIGKIRARAENFFATEDGAFLLHRRRFGEEGATSEFLRLDSQGKTLKTYLSQSDDSFNMSRKNGRRNFTIKAYNPTLVTSYNHATDEVLVGHSSEPWFKIYTGDKSLKVKTPIPRQDVTQADKDEYMQRFSTRSRKPTIEFPDKKAYYTNLISLGDKGYLVFTESPHYKNMEGVRVNKDGKVLGRFSMACGQGGALLASRGRALKIALNDDDEFEISELTVQ